MLRIVDKKLTIYNSRMIIYKTEKKPFIIYNETQKKLIYYKE